MDKLCHSYFSLFLYNIFLCSRALNVFSNIYLVASLSKQKSGIVRTAF